MQCPNCGTGVRAGDVFCGVCGTKLPTGTGVPEPVAPEPVAGPPIAPEPAVAYQQVPPPPSGGYRQPSAVPGDSGGYRPPVPPAGYGSQPGIPQPPKKSKKGLVIAIVVIVVVLLGCCIGSVIVGRALVNSGLMSIEDVVSESSDSDSGDMSEAEGDAVSDAASDATYQGYASADEAAEAALAEEGLSDWVCDSVESYEDWAVYWAGPPQSEYVYTIMVAQYDDGTWYLVEIGSVEDTWDSSVAGDADVAMGCVLEYLTCVYEDRGLDAQECCIDPFASDPAAAAVSEGGLTEYGITDYWMQDDGAVWVRTYEIWYDSYEEWDYYVVPTELGYRISDIAWVE